MNYNDIIRPKSVGDFIVPAATISILKQWVSVPEQRSSLLLYGPPGCGKSTCMRVLTSNLESMQLTATVSVDNRPFINSAMTFARSVSLFGQRKVLVIDEIDALTDKEQRKVSSILDETPCLLVASTNYLRKVYPALRSRCIELNFDPNQLSIEDIAIRLQRNIFNAVKTSGAKVTTDVVNQCIKQGFPDFRKIGLLLNATA